jgi:phosphate-selective porin OprO and OprP
VSVAFALLLLMIVLPASAQAQTGVPDEPAVSLAANPSPPPAFRSANGFDGVAFASIDGDFHLQVGLLVHADARTTVGDSSGQDADTFVLRRVRPYLRAQIAHRFEFFVNPDFSNTSAVVIQDLYIDAAVNPAFHLRFGKQKTPFGLERLQSALNLLFLERAMPTSVVPNRDIGVQASGDFHGGVVSYVAGVMNGVVDGGSFEHHSGDGKDVSGRMVVRPFSQRPAHPLHGLALAMSGSAGGQTRTSLRSFRTSIVQRPYFSYARGVITDGRRVRYSPQVSYYHGRFGGFGEYVHSEAPLRYAAVREAIDHDAWQVASSWVLTGEAATDAILGIQPRTSFDPRRGHWGAVQAAARYHSLTVDEHAFTLGLAAPGSSRRAAAWTAGVNWYLSHNVRCTANFERTAFDHNARGAQPAEAVLAFRTQLLF